MDKKQQLIDHLTGLGATKHVMMPDALTNTRGYNPAQFVFFAMTSRRADARAFDASISRDSIARTARQIGGVVKGGYILDGEAYAMPAPKKR